MTSRFIHPPELFVLRVALAIVAVDAVLIAVRGLSVDFAAYGALSVFAGLMMVLCYVYRRSGRSEAIAAAAISICLFIFFSASIAMFNYLMLPTGRPPIDVLLVRWDAALGHDWPSGIAWAARHPVLNEAMRQAYMSSRAQVFLLFLFLGLTGRIAQLHELMVTLTIACTITILFWGLFPTAGPTALETARPDLLAAVNPVLGQSYGPDMMALMRDGVPVISPSDFRGLVSFPSFHTVLALATVWYARSVKWLWPILLPVNLLVLLAVPVHGAHNLVDIGGGVAVLLFSIACTRRASRAHFGYVAAKA